MEHRKQQIPWLLDFAITFLRLLQKKQVTFVFLISFSDILQTSLT